MSNLNPHQFAEFRDPDEPFTYMPDRVRPQRYGSGLTTTPFDPYEDAPDVDPLPRRVN